MAWNRKYTNKKPILSINKIRCHQQEETQHRSTYIVTAEIPGVHRCITLNVNTIRIYHIVRLKLSKQNVQANMRQTSSGLSLT